MARPLTTWVQTLVGYSTGSNSYFYGILPNFTTLFALVLVSAAIAGTTALLASTASILPAMAASAGAALVNFWFSREIQTAMLGLTHTSIHKPGDVEKDWRYNLGLVNHKTGKAQLYHFAKAVDDLRSRINQRYPNDAPLPRPRLGTFAEAHHELVVTGRNPGKALIAIANFGTFELFAGKPRQFNALILQALAQIKLRATFSGMVVGILMDFGVLLKGFQNHDFAPFRLFGFMVSPLGQLLINAMSRTNAYYRADRIVAECGYGQDLIEALNTINQPGNIDQKPTHRKYDFRLMSDLPESGELKKNKIYFEKVGGELSYTILFENKAIIRNLSISFDDVLLTPALLDSKREVILDAIATAGHLPAMYKIKPEPKGFFAAPVRLWRKIEKVVREDGYPGEDETGYILLSFIDNMVSRFANYFKELFSAAPRIGHRKNMIQAYLDEYKATHGGQLPPKTLPLEEYSYKLCNPEKLRAIVGKEAYDTYGRSAGHHHGSVVHNGHSNGHHDHSKTKQQQPATTEGRGPAAVIFTDAAPAVVDNRGLAEHTDTQAKNITDDTGQKLRA